MVGVLGFISEKLNEISIPYEFGEWTQEVTYPYFVGTYNDIDYRFEDEYTAGTLTLDGWARGSGGKLMLAEKADLIKETFSDLQVVQDGSLYYVRYGNTLFVPSGVADLFRVSINLNLYEWKG